MSQTTETSTDSDQTHLNENTARKDVCDFLAERAELRVNYEEIITPNGVAERPVARTQDGEKADVSDFPSGKNTGHGSFSKKTFTRYRDTVSDFLQSQGVTDLQEVSPREISRWNQSLQRRDYARTTRAAKLQTLETFLKWAESEFRAPRDEYRLSETVNRKRKDLDVSQSEKSRAGDENHRISQNKADEILSHLARHDYASRQMVEFLLIYRIGCRRSALLAINIDDVKPDRGVIEIRNRPEETGVRLKKGNSGERDVNVSHDVLRIVQEYIEEKRKTPKDGSQALLTSAYGRIDGSTLNRDIGGLTMCEDCTETRTKQTANECDESIGPHDLRRTAITRFRDLGMSWDTISGRVNATVKMLKDHYDSPTHAQAAERRESEVRRLLGERPPK